MDSFLYVPRAKSSYFDSNASSATNFQLVDFWSIISLKILQNIFTLFRRIYFFTEHQRLIGTWVIDQFWPFKFKSLLNWTAISLETFYFLIYKYMVKELFLSHANFYFNTTDKMVRFLYGDLSKVRQFISSQKIPCLKLFMPVGNIFGLYSAQLRLAGKMLIFARLRLAKIFFLGS